MMRWLQIALLWCAAGMPNCALVLGAQADPHSRLDQPFTEFFRRTNGWTAGDGALSVPLSDGRVLWLFGDSHVDDVDVATGTMQCLFQARNAGLLHGTNELRNAKTLIGSGAGFRSWFKHPTDDQIWFWPGCGYQADGEVVIYLNALRSTGKGGKWGFESTGQDYLARLRLSNLHDIAYVGLQEFEGIAFGSGFVVQGQHILAFGTRRDGTAGNVFVARFPSAHPEKVWSFWDGRSWATNPASAAVIARGASTSVHVCKVKDSFLMTTSEFSVTCDQGRAIYMATSSTPTGPFSRLKDVYEISDRYQNHVPFFYMAVAHPEFINQAQEILVTYSINGYEPCVPTCVTNRAFPDHYRPRAIRVPLSLIDSRL